MDTMLENLPRFLLLLAALGAMGWFSWELFFSFLLPGQAETKNRGKLFKPFCILFSGVATLSVSLLIFGVFGLFSLRAFGALLLVLAALYIMKLLLRRGPFPFRDLIHYVIVLLFLTLASDLFITFSRPYEAVVYTNDPATYTATSWYLVDHGSLRHTDSLVSEMTEQERRIFFFRSMTRGQGTDKVHVRERFNGGLKLFDGKTLEVGSGLFPLLPLWLAFGNLFYGQTGFIYMLCLLAVLALLVLYVLGRSLTNGLVALVFVTMCLLFYPQAYQMRIALSEILLQLLVLSGLCLFIRATSEDTRPSIKLQLFIGLLWGCTLFCKLEMFLFLPLCLSAVFVAVPKLRKNVLQWQCLLQTLSLFFVLALLYQYDAGSFIRQIRNWLFGLRIFQRPLKFLEDETAIRTLLFVSLWLVSFYLFRKKGALSAILKKTGAPLVAGGLLLFYGAYLYLRFAPFKVVGVWEWQTYYAVPWVWGVLAVGVLAHGISGWKQGNGIVVVLLFWLLPGFVYFMDPMVHGVHPFAIRRFVPLFYPLFFLMSLHGFMWLGRKYLSKPVPRLKYVCLAPAVICMFAFSGETRSMWKQPLYENLISQLKPIEDSLPADSLVLVPFSLRESALPVPLQYLNRIDTLILPADEPDGGKVEATVVDFIRKRMEKGRVFEVLASNAAPPSILNRNFSHQLHSRHRLDMHALPQHPVFDPEPKAFDYELIFYQLGSLDALPPFKTLDIGNPGEDLPFLLSGFHDPATDENGSYRWTTERAIMKIPAVKKFRIHFCLVKPDGSFCRSIKIRINSQDVEVPEIPSEKYAWITLDVPEAIRDLGPFMSLEINVEASTLEAMGIAGEDNRLLGIRVYEIEVIS